MRNCTLYLNMTITPVIFSPTEIITNDGVYRKVPCFNQWVSFHPFCKEKLTNTDDLSSSQDEKVDHHYKRKRKFSFDELEESKEGFPLQLTYDYISTDNPFKNNDTHEDITSENSSYMVPNQLDYDLIFTYSEPNKQPKESSLLGATISSIENGLDDDLVNQNKQGLQENLNDDVNNISNNDKTYETSKPFSILDFLKLGDQITVYDKHIKIDTGHLVMFNNNHFIWTDSDGHTRFQFIEGPITIQKH